MLASSIRFYTKAGWARWMHHGSAPSNKPLRGMVDYWGQECEKHRFITETAAEVARSYGYEEIRTPILEDISVFKRSLGDDSDVIGKELYTFVDKNGQEVVMRPEGTAGVTRAMVSENLQYRLPQKLYYAGPMFRHERPQRGRLRQFTQVGIEVFGHAYPSADIECIAVGMKFLQNLGLGDSIELKINSLGNAETRAKYRGELRKYLEDYREELSADSQRRMDTNPLRILDSKSHKDQEILTGAPVLSDYLDVVSRDHYEFVKDGLAALSIPFVHDSKLVRGLDYYQRTVWEIVYGSADGTLGESQGTILAGGRYDGLLGTFGGPADVPSIGWAAGVERIALCLTKSHLPSSPPPVYILIAPEKAAAAASDSNCDNSRSVSPQVVYFAMQVAEAIRGRGHRVHTLHPKNGLGGNHQHLSKQITRVLAQNPRHIVIVGPEEYSKGLVILKSVDERAQNECSIDELLELLARDGGTAGLC